MELFPPGRLYDFMAMRRVCVTISIVMVVGSLVMLLWRPGPRLGTDFRGGTEIEVAFKQPVEPGQIREAITSGAFSHPDVVSVDDPNNPHRFLIRVQEVTAIDTAQQAEIERALCYGDNPPADQCPPEKRATEVKVSPGGDKITVRFPAAPDLGWIEQRASTVPKLALRKGENNPTLVSPRDNKVEIQLESKGDQLMQILRDKLGPEKVPDHALRAEWIGPKAGAQLRDAAIKSLVISLVLVMAYVAFRFDVRFAPGGVIALIHDATIAVGVLILLGREINLTTIAALLTIVGYSINDTVVVYDRVRENLGKLRGTSFKQLINVSISEMLGRTMITNGTVVFSLLAFFVWGTGTLKDFALTLIVGVVAGTYSSIYIALPITDTLDRVLFSKIGRSKPRPQRRAAEASI
jgi:preprotein translocase subunit SecF